MDSILVLLGLCIAWYKAESVPSIQARQGAIMPRHRAGGAKCGATALLLCVRVGRAALPQAVGIKGGGGGPVGKDTDDAHLASQNIQ